MPVNCCEYELKALSIGRRVNQSSTNVKKKKGQGCHFTKCTWLTGTGTVLKRRIMAKSRNVFLWPFKGFPSFFIFLPFFSCFSFSLSFFYLFCWQALRIFKRCHSSPRPDHSSRTPICPDRESCTSPPTGWPGFFSLKINCLLLDC